MLPPRVKRPLSRLRVFLELTAVYKSLCDAEGSRGRAELDSGVAPFPPLKRSAGVAPRRPVRHPVLSGFTQRLVSGGPGCNQVYRLQGSHVRVDEASGLHEPPQPVSTDWAFQGPLSRADCPG